MLATYTSLGQRENEEESLNCTDLSKNALKQKKKKNKKTRNLKTWRLIKRQLVDFKVKEKYEKLGETIRKP